MSQIDYHPAFEKDLRRLPPIGGRLLRDQIIPELARGAISGFPLRGPLRGYIKYRFTVSGQPYRLVYSHPIPGTLYIVGVGKRGEFYERLRRRLE